MMFSTSRSRSFVLIALMAVLLMVALMTCYSTSASAAMSMLRRHDSAGSTPKYGRPSAVHVKHTPELSEHGAVAAAAAATAAAAPAAVPSTAPITSSLRDNGKNTAHHPAHPRAFNPQDSSSVYIWPLPKQVTSGSVQRTLAHPLTVELNTDSDDVMNAVDRYTSIIFPHSTAVTPVGSLLTTLVINVNNLTDVSPPLQLGVNETYTLYVPSDANSTTMYISADNFFGVLRALETFSQVVQWDAATMTYFIANAPWSIVDEPRFAHRGVLLDTSRHFEPIASIMEFLDALSYAKLNLFHWHLSDHQSFPYHSQSLPRLSMGAYSLADRYTLQDVADVVEYARQRGIRVMLEFDVPGHASSWCAGYPDVCPSTTCLTPLDPSTENVFKLMTTLFNDFTNSTRGSGVVYDDFFHLGGDEVDTSCWTETPRIAQWLAQQNYTADQAYMYVVERAQKIIQAQGRDPVNWEEVYNHFGTKLPRSTVVHIWLDKNTLAKATADGFRAILSDQDFWYLDHLDTTWQQFYLNEPLSGITDPAQQKLVLGGEACMWGETVDTSDMLQTIWPRGAAFAERMWSPASVNDTDAALPRLQWYRCLLNDRGVQAAPTLNPEARSAPSGPGACLSQ